MTIAKKVRDYKEANPKATCKEIAKACSVSYSYVYQLINPKKKVKKLPKAFPIKKKEPTDGQKTVRSELSRLHEDIEGWRSLYLNSLEELEQLQQDVIGYRAVISYLQGQLDGLTV